jgi:hypothetical protein
MCPGSDDGSSIIREGPARHPSMIQFALDVFPKGVFWAGAGSVSVLLGGDLSTMTSPT